MLLVLQHIFPNTSGTYLQIRRWDKDSPELLSEQVLCPSTNSPALQKSQDRIAYLQSGVPGQDRPTSVFDTTLHPNTEKGQFTPPIKDLAADAFAFLMAGTDTTATVLTTAVFNLLHGQTHMLERLKGELRELMPDRDATADWYTLEKLTYLVC